MAEQTDFERERQKGYLGSTSYVVYKTRFPVTKPGLWEEPTVQGRGIWERPVTCEFLFRGSARGHPLFSNGPMLGEHYNCCRRPKFPQQTFVAQLVLIYE